MYTPNKQ